MSILKNLARLTCAPVFCLALLMSLTAAHAQTGTIKIVVGYPPGATSDMLTRVLADAMSKRLGQPVIVENKTGAGGQIGNIAVKSAKADGTTLLMTPVATMSIFPHSFAGRLQYDPFNDFVPVAHLTNFQVGLGVSTRVPVKTLTEYISWVKADPSKNGLYGSAANGSLPHFFGVMFGKAAGLELSHVPYRGTASAMQALMGGEIDTLSTVAADLRTLVQSDKARLLAVAGEKRSPNFPEVPTFRELGYDLVAKPWYALFAPAGTSPEVVARLSKAAIDSIRDAALNARLVEMGLEPTGLGPTQLAAIMKADYEHWGPPIKASGFKPK